MSVSCFVKTLLVSPKSDFASVKTMRERCAMLVGKSVLYDLAYICTILDIRKGVCNALSRVGHRACV